MLTLNRRKRLRAAAASSGGWRSISVFRSRTAEENRDTSNYTHSHALQLAPVTAVVTYIARAFAASELVVEQRVGERWERRTTNIPPWADPQMRPNWLQSNYDFRFNLAANLLVAGSAAVRVLSRRGVTPDEVISIPSHLVYIQPMDGAPPESPEDYDGLFRLPGYGPMTTVVYEVDGMRHKPYTANTRDGSLLYMRLLSYDDTLYGRSPLQWAAPPVRTAIAADAYAEYGLTTPWPHGILTAKGAISKENAKAVQTDFENIRKSPNKTHIPVVTTGDWNFVTTYIPPDQIQLVETRKLAFSQVCAIYNFPEALISSPSARLSGAAYRQVMQGYAKGVQVPFNNQITGYLSELLPVGWRVRAVPKHMTIDEAEQSRVLDRYIRNGVIHRSEARAEIGLPEWPGIDEEAMPGSGMGPGDRGGDSDSGMDTGGENEKPTDTDG